MDPITTRGEFADQLETLKALEKKARDDYEQDLQSYTYFELISKIKKIKEEEEYHIEILDELINMLKK